MFGCYAPHLFTAAGCFAAYRRYLWLTGSTMWKGCSLVKTLRMRDNNTFILQLVGLISKVKIT